MRVAPAILAVTAALGATGCPEHGSRPGNGTDGGFLPDAPLTDRFCMGGPSNIQLTTGPTINFTTLAAGGIWETGPVAVAQPPMTINLLFTNEIRLTEGRAQCCANSDPICCPNTDGIVAHSNGALQFGGELGTHAFTVTDTKNSFSITGTVNIDAFTQPFLSAPGRIAGSISAVSSGRTISGTFDSAFCGVLLSQTI
jgi:hypothetical protein